MDESDADASETDPLVCASGKADVKPDATKIKKNELRPIHPPPSKSHLPPPPPPKELPPKRSQRPLQPLQEYAEEPCMEEVHLPETNKSQEGSTVLCPFFGVKNYLHYFYEKPDVKDHLYLMDANEDMFLLKRREGICSSSAFRLSLILGGIILLMGTTAFIVAICSPRRATIVGKMGGISVVDRVAASHNAEMDALLLVSLLAVTLGATVIAASLLIRTFWSTDYDDQMRIGDMSSVRQIYEHPAVVHHIERRVPATEELTSIQPSSFPGYLSTKLHSKLLP